LLLSQLVFCQKTVPVFGKINWISGYEKEISGENISYFSAYPDYATVALLTRCTDGNKQIEWESAPVPKDTKGQFVYFSWVAAHSSGTSSGERFFDLYLNDEKLLTFSTLPDHQRPDWSFAAADSSRLVFQQTKRDGANDAHGLAYLRVPIKKITPGKAAKFKVVGQAQNSNDWYMTFKFTFEEKVDIEPMPFLLKNGKQPVVLTALHFGPPQKMEVRVNNKDNYQFTAQEGVNTFDIPLPAVKQLDSTHIKVTVGKQVLVNKFVQQKPIIHRELHFLHHSHTDIGYSHLQPVVADIHNQNIDDALDMIAATKDFPEEARFKWNIESLWAVENYLGEASPEKQAKFVQAVQEGSISLSALYANFLTGMSEPEEMFHYTDYAEKLKKKYGFSITTSMISDIPGVAWTTVTALAKSGVQFLTSGPNYVGRNNPYLGDRVGHFVKTWGDRPAWWASPSGEEKILFWTAGQGYSGWHGMGPGAVFDRGPKKIAAYLNDLAEKDYPYDIVQWRYNIVADNGPIDTSISRFVLEWNKKYASPRIILNTSEKLFDAFVKKYGPDIPTVKGDITPYWEDGAISTAHEEGKTRSNSLRLQQLPILYSMLKPSAYKEDEFYEAWKNILLFHEHTWGAHNSISQPDVPFVTEQWRIKKQFFLDNETQVNALEQQLLQAFFQKESKKIAVFNSLSWKRSGPVFIQNAAAGRSVRDGKGKLWPVQKMADGSLAFWANDIPALGTAFFEIVDEEAPIQNTFPSLGENSLANGRIKVQWDKDNGSITELKALGNFNYAGDFNQQGLNSYWYVYGLNPADAKSNGQVKVKVLEHGPVLTSVSISSEAPGALKLERVLTLYAQGNEVEIENIVDKKAVRDKEGLHFGFPFEASLNDATLDAGYGSMKYLKEQLPGSNMDFLYARRWVDVSAHDKGLQLMLLEAPLIEPASIIDEQRVLSGSVKAWKEEGQPTSTFFSYAMNNYWHTNYKADQEGIARFHYALRPHGQFNHSEMEKSAAAFTQPLVGLPVNESASFSPGLFELGNERIVVTAIVPQENGGYLLRLFNPEPSAENTNIMWKTWKPAPVLMVNTGQKFGANDEFKIAAMGVAEFFIQQ
jgi:hypothetical protein